MTTRPPVPQSDIWETLKRLIEREKYAIRYPGFVYYKSEGPTNHQPFTPETAERNRHG